MKLGIENQLITLMVLLMSPYYVYIVRCKGGTLYTGYTNNIKRRLKEHNNGQSKYCRGRRPVKLQYFEIFKNQKSAMRRELEIKKLTRKLKLKLIKSNSKKQIEIVKH